MTPDELRDALRGVRGFVLDADGVLVLKGAPIPGAIDALRALEAKGVPFRVVTNYSQAHRNSLAARFMAAGLPVGPDRIITAVSAVAAYTAERYPGKALFVLAAPDALSEFDGQTLLSPDEADTAPRGTVAAVVIGDAGNDLSYRNLDIAFRLLRSGAGFLAMHRNPWWLTPRGETLDAGAMVVGLEFSTGERARVLGKPSPDVFRQAAAGLVRDLGGRVRRRDLAMVGDDPAADVAGAQRAGLRAFLVLTGKTTAAEAERLMAPARSGGRPRIGRPDGVASSLAELVAALD
jgi:HAD superfamily hydrolase (TIGR01450 family)